MRRQTRRRNAPRPSDDAESMSGSPRTPHRLDIIRTMIWFSSAAFSRPVAARPAHRSKSVVRCVQSPDVSRQLGWIVGHRAMSTQVSSRAELLELVPDGLHQRGDDLLAEVEPDAGRGEELGQRPRAAQRQGLLVVGHGRRRDRSATAARSARRRAGRSRTRCNRTDTRKCGAGDARNGRGPPRSPTSRRCRRTGRAASLQAALRSSRVWSGWV